MIPIAHSIRSRLRGNWLICALAVAAGLGLGSPALRAQEFIYWPDNYNYGTTYFDSDTEIGGNGFVDSDMEVVGDLNADSSVYVGGTLYANNLDVTYLSSTYSLEDFSISNNFELFSDFSPGISESWGVGGSWLHANLDFGDLTYTGTDTPAFNISQLNSGGQLYPTIYYTGYDGNTTWVWQENGLAMQNYDAAPGVQMTLDGGGNLTLNNPADGSSLAFSPSTGSVVLNNSAGALTFSDANGDSITIDASTQNLTFYNGTSHSSQSISPESLSITLASSGSGFIYGTGASASGSNAVAIGNHASGTGNGAFAIGNNITAAYFDSIVIGQWNAPISGASDGNTTWNATDPLFVIGNGQSNSSLSNALVILKNGNTTVNGDLTVTGNATFNGTTNTLGGNVSLPGNTTVAPQGDILMGQFGD